MELRKYPVPSASACLSSQQHIVVMSDWEPTAVKAQLRLTTQRLGALQERQDAQGQTQRREIATLLSNGEISNARASALQLDKDERGTDVLELIGHYVSLLLQNFTLLENLQAPSPLVIEAASSIIYAAPYTISNDAKITREMLIHRLGPEFAKWVIKRRDKQVSIKILRALHAPEPTPENVDAFLIQIARSYNVQWTPDPKRHEISDQLQTILNPSSSLTVDMAFLRHLCSHGLPDEPTWIRPRVWKLFFGVLPPDKDMWDVEIHRQRQSYYDLVRRLLTPLADLSSVAHPRIPSDRKLLDALKPLEKVPPGLFGSLRIEPDDAPTCPLDHSAPEGFRLECAENLEQRLHSLRAHKPPTQKPVKVHLGETETDTPKISVSTPEALTETTILTSHGVDLGGAHAKHCAVLRRILYLHASLNPAKQSPHTPSLLVPLYAVMLQETEPRDIAHVEADTFWVYEAMISDVSELEDEELGKQWLAKFSDRLKWADAELAADLTVKGLDPGLPHYSYRWLAPLLSHTLPLSSMILVWDTIFSGAARSRDSNQKLEILLDVCTSMLMRARAPLFRLAKPDAKSPYIWTEENVKIPPPSPLPPWQLGTAFIEGVSMLEKYPISTAGGIDWILQTASELNIRRLREEQARMNSNTRTRTSYWSALTQSMRGNEDEDDEDDEVAAESDEDAHGEEADSSTKLPSLSSRFASTFWKGTGKPVLQEPLPPDLPPLVGSPMSPNSPLSPDPLPVAPLFGDVSVGPRLRDYAEKLKASDTAATLSKVSTNWRARAVDAWNQRKSNDSPASSPAQVHRSRLSTESMPPDGYTPPPMPAIFRSPKEDLVPLDNQRNRATSPEAVFGQPKVALDSLVRSTREQFTSLVRSQAVESRQTLTRSSTAGPRPLLLSTSPVSSPVAGARSAVDPAVSPNQWSAVMKHKGRFGGNGTQSISSLSPSDALSRPWDQNHTNSDHGSDSESRIVPLRQRSVSPMAMASKHRAAMSHDSPLSSTYTSAVGDKGLPPIPRSPVSSEKGWGQVDLAVNEDSLNAVTNSAKQYSYKNLGRTPPTSFAPHRINTSLGSESDSSISQAPVTLTPKTRTRKYRPTRLQTKGPSRSPQMENKLPPLPTSNMLFPESRTGDDSPTPRASEFESNSLLDGGAHWTASPAGSVEGSPEPHIHQLSVDKNEARTRKTSGSSSRSRGSRRNRESAAVEGDDEGYDDLLSAYSEEEGRRRVAVVM